MSFCKLSKIAKTTFCKIIDMIKKVRHHVLQKPTFCKNSDINILQKPTFCKNHILQNHRHDKKSRVSCCAKTNILQNHRHDKKKVMGVSCFHFFDSEYIGIAEIWCEIQR